MNVPKKCFQFNTSIHSKTLINQYPFPFFYFQAFFIKMNQP